MPTKPSKVLETFPNPHPERDYIIEIETPEFTCLCPKTGQPDFATLQFEYVPDERCVELKSLKLYLWSYRDAGAFHEKVTNQILDDLVAAVNPRYARVRAYFNVRGGLYTTVDVDYRQGGWNDPPPPPDNLPRVKKELPAQTVAQDSEGENGETIHGTSQRFRMLRRTNKPAATAAARSAPKTPARATAPKAPPKPARTEPLFVGIDFGTTGCRAVAINGKGTQVAIAEAPIPAPISKGDQQYTQDPTQWTRALNGALEGLCKQIDPKNVQTLAVDGTSGTILLTDDKGAPVAPAILYNDGRAIEQAERVADIADPHSGAHGATSGLAKLLWLHEKNMAKRAAHVLHQADWIAGRLTGIYGHSDYNNCLKLGYDAMEQRWPAWMQSLDFNKDLLPQVMTPGEALGPVAPDIAKQYGLLPDTGVVAGTTDGVAAFLAAGARTPGHGVTSLGTTLVLKLLSDKPIFAPEYGVYSHRLGKYWLAGGASNSGGAVLLQYFKVEQMREMTPLLDPDSPTGLDYYPLAEVGERFPINDPEMMPRLEPLPGDSVAFFQGMLEGIATIEALGYQLLHELGAPALSAIWTTGGGSTNPAWEKIRARVLGVKMHKARSRDAAFGTALLAAGAIHKLYN